MKKRVFAVLIAAVMMMTILTGCSGKKLMMATGGTSGTYYGFGGALSQMVSQKTDTLLVAISTGASKENIQNVNAGQNQLAIVQNDVMAYAYNGTNTFQNDGPIQTFSAVGGLYEEQIQIITMDPEIKTVEDLKGKSVSIGAAGSGTFYNAMDILAVYGMSEADIRPQYLSFGDSTEGMKDGKIEAAFIVAGAPTNAVTELSTSNDVYLVSLDEEHIAELLEKCPYYTEAVIPANTYGGQTEECTTVTVKATMIAGNDVPEEDVYQLMKTIFENTDQIAHAKAAELDPTEAVKGIAVPFHPGAVKFYAEQGISID